MLKSLSDSSKKRYAIFHERGCIYEYYLEQIHSRPQSPRCFWPAAGIESSLGATTSGMRHRCRLRETGWAEFGYFLRCFKMVAPFRPLVKENEDSGNEIGANHTNAVSRMGRPLFEGSHLQITAFGQRKG